MERGSVARSSCLGPLLFSCSLSLPIRRCQQRGGWAQLSPLVWASKTRSLALAGGNKIPGVDHAKIAKLDRDNEVAPPATVSMELGKVLQKARQDYKDSEGKPKPMSQGDLAKMINVKGTVVQEYENMKAKPDPAILGKMERILKVKLRGAGIGQPLGGPKKK
ncbi:hypothetical protein BCR35DRAFT_326517 [Leucosporidium creatinivorum]|uniref:HTH cro/C1-type domain-containing protein n=1 Tax=Leucosporidium creatinivorum TaxID=106004 RepID=A0A1Y2E5Q3_9BASI|nr:hypothetical protein BCR35DRAFT_326517 [Leucosporidium creatinivorum]